MFIKKEFEEKMRKKSIGFETEEEFYQASQKQKKAPKIGSCRLPRMTYERDEQFFTREEIPRQAIESKQYIQDLVDPDLLGLRKKGWNKSVKSAKEHIGDEEDFQRKLTKIKMGLNDFPMPKYKEKNIEPGTDLRDNYTGWNVSTEVANKFERSRQLETFTKTALTKTQLYFDKARSKINLLYLPPRLRAPNQRNHQGPQVTKTHMLREELNRMRGNKTTVEVGQMIIDENNNKRNMVKDYLKPDRATDALNEELRHKKRLEKPERDRLREQFVFENPNATKERVEAGVFRMIYENQVKGAKPQSEELLLNLTFKPDMTKTLKHDIVVKRYHNGKWGKCTLPNHPEECWSCCASDVYESEGCMAVNVDKGKWNLVSYT